MAAPHTFKTSVDSFEEASTDMARINKYLTELHEFLNQFDWKTVSKDRNGQGGMGEDGGGRGPGGEGSGTKPPPGWP
jgi:hypothetical protein